MNPNATTPGPAEVAAALAVLNAAAGKTPELANAVQMVTGMSSQMGSMASQSRFPSQPPPPGMGAPVRLGAPPRMGAPLRFGSPPRMGAPPRMGPPPHMIGPPRMGQPPHMIGPPGMGVPPPRMGVPPSRMGVPPPRIGAPPRMGVPPFTGPPPGHPPIDVESLPPRERYNLEIASKDWVKRYGKVPGFDDFQEYLDRKKSTDWMSFCGRVPEFMDYVAFRRELDTKDWITLCKVIPTFQDYVMYTSKKVSEEHDCGRTMTFRDYLDYFRVGNSGRLWADVYKNKIRFVDYLKFAELRDSRNWDDYCPAIGIPNFRDYLLYRNLLETRDFETTFLRTPTFLEFMEFEELKVKNDYEKECGIKASFEKLLEYKEHNKSRDWMSFCGIYPSFKDYLMYLSHENSENWLKLKHAFNDKPFFTDYMQFKKMCASKRWADLGQVTPTFDQYILYLIFRASRDCRIYLIEQIPLSRRIYLPIASRPRPSVYHLQYLLQPPS